jgi:hypothetical protein
VRSVVMDAPHRVNDDPVRALIRQALERSSPPIPADGPVRLVIKSVSGKQRPRRPQ